MAAKQQKTINIALQGGGAHGAFTWGVLDKILEDGRLDIEGMCSCSAGTVNALAYAYGLTLNGRDGAREKLEEFWKSISDIGLFLSPVKGGPWHAWLNHWNMDHSPGFMFFDTITRTFSPYQFNPLDINPLRDVMESVLDFEVIRKCNRTKLFISATNVHTGKVRVFNTDELSMDVALASSCLPFLFKAVEIDGEHYWDGGYSGNPALFPLFYHTDSQDIMIVHVNPLNRDDIPITAPQIMNRVNEISFNASLLKEMRAISFVQKLIEEDWLKDEHKNKLKYIYVHSIPAKDATYNLSVASKFNTDWQFLQHLRDIGRKVMQQWLDAHFSDIGEKSTVDIREEFLAFNNDHGLDKL